MNRLSDNCCQKIDNEPDFINSKRNNDSLKDFLNQHPNGCDDATICRLLKIPKDKFADIFSQLLEKMQTSMHSC